MRDPPDPRSISAGWLWAGVLVLAVTGLGGADASPESDLSLTFSSERTVSGPGNIVGALTNKSALRYPCVDAIFSLSTHFEDRQKGMPARSYGNQSVRVRDIGPGRTVRFSAPLSRKAGFGFSGYSLCARPVAEDSGQPPPPPTQSQACTVTGRVGSSNGFAGFDDRRRRETIEWVYVLDAGTGSLVKKVPLGNAQTRVRDHRVGRDYVARSYSVAELPANRRYLARLSNAWRTQPPQVEFGCPDSRGRSSFGVPVLIHTGNNLGG